MRLLFQFVVISILFFSCAQVVPPAGGDKDITPPKIVSSNPTNFSTNQLPQTIEIEFDEYVIQRSLVNELLISPPLKEFPEYYFKGKKFYLEFKDTLKPNTTYQFNFGKGLVDLNENNPLDSNIIVFSTGNYLDSLSIKGEVIDALELSMAKDIAVLLYQSLEDSVVAKQKPDYYSRTKKDGSFSLDFIANGDFQLFALEDKNGNFLYDLPNERLAFMANSFSLNADTAYSLRLFEEENKKQFVKEFKMENPFKLVCILNQETENVRLNPVGKTFKKDWYFINQKMPNDSIIFWVPEPQALDTLQFMIEADGAILDTNELLFDVDSTKYPKLELNPINNTGGVPYFEGLKITSNFPIKTIDESKIFIIKDSIPQEFQLAFTKNSNEFEIKANWENEKRYQLIIEDSSILGIGNIQCPDSLDIGFGVRDSTKFGDIFITLDSLKWNKQLVLLLMDAQGKSVKRKLIGKAAEDFVFKRAFLGKYKLKLILDADENEKWSSGSYGEKRLPEKTFIYEGEIELSANADLNIKWRIPEKLINNGQ